MRRRRASARRWMTEVARYERLAAFGLFLTLTTGSIPLPLSPTRRSAPPLSTLASLIVSSFVLLPAFGSRYLQVELYLAPY
jgi:hypothetical protein